MTRSVIINSLGTVRETSDQAFFASIFGHAPKTKAEREAEYNAEVQRYVELILNGCDPSEYGNPCVTEAKRLIAEREAAECGPDPLIHLEPKRAA